MALQSEWKPGSRYQARTNATTVSPDVEIAYGENLDVEPLRHPAQTFRALWSEEVKVKGTLTTPASQLYVPMIGSCLTSAC